MKTRVVMIGAGNLAVNLAQALDAAGIKIVQVYSRTQESAQWLANRLDTGWTNVPGKILRHADLYFIALKDDVIVPFLEQMKFDGQFLVHCSGSLPLSDLSPFSRNTGVFYPLQTFSRSTLADFSDIPVFLEANTGDNEKILAGIAGRLSRTVISMDSAGRKNMHISAVFACNFVNHMYTVAARLLEDKDLNFDLLVPLIRETCRKVETLHPLEAQTGPAVRNDKTILASHDEALKDYPAFREIYRILSGSISEMA